MKGLAKKPNLVFLIAIRGIQIPQEADISNKLENYLQLANLLLQNNVEQWAFKLERILTLTYIATKEAPLKIYHGGVEIKINATVRICNGLLHGKDHSAKGYAYYYPNAGKAWWRYGKKHRMGAPAIIYTNDNNRVEWYYDGKFHRDDGPAVIMCSKKQYHEHTGFKDVTSATSFNALIEYTNHTCQYTEEWYQHGDRHRIDGPATVKVTDTIAFGWFKNNKWHRENGPAYKEGAIEHWYIDGKLHRVDESGGPAYINENGMQCWYLHDKLQYADYGNGHTMIVENGLEHHTYPSGTEVWERDNKYHRDGEPGSAAPGPAIITKQGHRAWYQNGLLHRIDGPAVITPNGEKWYQFGRLHRTDGPAFITAAGEQKWYQFGRLHRTDGPAFTTSDGQRWYQFGRLHRTDGPSIIFPNGKCAFHQYGNTMYPNTSDKILTKAELPTEYRIEVRQKPNGVVEDVFNFEYEFEPNF